MSKKSSTMVEVDVTPVSFQCYDTGECPAINVLKNEMPSVKIEPRNDGTFTAKCPIPDYPRAQQTVNTICMGCRARGVR